MAYTKHIWDCDELITADKLNHIEDGIVEAEQSGGGGGIVLHSYTGRIASVPAGGYAYVDVPITTLGTTDPDKIVIVSCQYSIGEYRADNPATTEGIAPGYSIRRDAEENSYVRLLATNKGSNAALDVPIRIVYAIEGESSGSSVITQGDFIILEGNVPNVQNGGAGSVSWTASDLGVDSIDDVVPISVRQTTAGQNRYGNTFNTTMSGMTTYSNVYPILAVSGSSLYLSVLNGAEGTGTADIPYQVVFMKLHRS